VSELLETPPRGGELLSTDAVRLAEQATGGPALWFLWRAGSGQDSLQLPVGLILRADPISVSTPDLSIERGARLFEEATERWRGTQHPPKAPKQRRTPLGRRLDEIRARIEASGQPLLSWEDIDRELAELRGEEP
jgi:hypothetical protein